MIKEFDVATYDKTRPIIIYGTSVFGKLICHLLDEAGIQPLGFADKNNSEQCMGYSVFNLKQLKQKIEEDNCIILLGVTKYMAEVVEQLKLIEINELYNAVKLIQEIRLPNINLEKGVWEAYVDWWKYNFYLNKIYHRDDLYMLGVDIVVSEKCSLRCKHCSNLMQYYSHPINVDLDELKKSLDRLLGVVDCIGELRILGGEPFMNLEFYKVIDWYKDNSKIMKVGIYTNATILPSNEILSHLQSDKIIMRISDYGELSGKLKEWIDFCEEKGISYIISRMDEWHDLGKLEKRNYEEAEIREIYKTCECNDLATLLHGKLYNCPYAAHAVNLGALSEEEEKEDYISFESDGDICSREQLYKFLFERPYLKACEYCSGRNFKLGKIVLPHEQAKAPLTYERRKEVVK